MLRSRVMVDLLTWNAIVAFSEQCEAKLVHVVLLLYLAHNYIHVYVVRITLIIFEVCVYIIGFIYMHSKII